MRLPTRKTEQERWQNTVSDPHITPEKLQRLQQELAHLQNAHPQAKAEMQRTAEEGDFSENAGYQDAKRRLRSINTRLLTLQERINQAILIEGGSKDGLVRIGSTVRLKNTRGEKTLRLVGSQEVDIARGQISYSSPLGAALLGKSVGATVHLNKTTWNILEIK